MPYSSEPEVSIVIAAYGRPDVLIWAIKSVLAQTWQDWELIIVGDACPCTTKMMAIEKELVSDDRIKFFNLLLNVGDQSGPNNFGVAHARGRYIAFLNQDDLWFPEHLLLCMEHMDSSGADIVFTYSGAMVSTSENELVSGNWLGGLTGIPKNGGFDSSTTFAPASSWLIKRELVKTVGPWKSAAECVIAPSQDFLFRAWRQKLRIRSCPELTVLTFSSGGRRNSYLEDLSYEQRWWFETVGLNDDARSALWIKLAYIHPSPPAYAFLQVFTIILHFLMRGLAQLGVEPLAIVYRVRNGLEKGQYIDKLRKTRGLETLGGKERTIQRMRRRAVEKTCKYSWGNVIDFSVRGNAHAYQLEGWSLPEAWGTWTEGEQATLLIRFAEVIYSEFILNLNAQGFAAESGRKQRVIVLINGVEHACLQWLEPSFMIMTVTLSSDMISAEGFIAITFKLLDCIAPAKVAPVNDFRRLGIAVNTFVVQHC